MGKLVCEVCGSSLTKQEGVFVCDNCGCKYSLEEAKKLYGSSNGSVRKPLELLNEDEKAELAEKFKDELSIIRRLGFDAQPFLESLSGLKTVAGTVTEYVGASNEVLITENDDIHAIKSDAFNKLKGINRVLIYGDIKVATDAFKDCSTLIVLYSDGKGVEENAFTDSYVYWIPNSNEYECRFRKNLICFVTPSNVTSVTENAFADCYNLSRVELGNSITKISEYAFNNCTSLKTINLPSSLTDIGECAFGNCSRLASLNIPSTVTRIAKYAFYACSYLKSMVIPQGITAIGENSFGDCLNLVSIELPSSITSIGKYAFDGCSYLKDIVIPDAVTTIGENAFSWCSALTSIKIPYGVEKIEKYTFRGCTNLESIEIPDTVTSIGENAFEGCRNLKYLRIPASVTTIGKQAFYGCNEDLLKSLHRCTHCGGELTQTSPVTCRDCGKKQG